MGGAGLLVILAIIVIVSVRFLPIAVGWRSVDQWSDITEAIKRQPETQSVGWLPPQNRSIRYVVGPGLDDVIDATTGSSGALMYSGRRSRLIARSPEASAVLRRAVAEACDNRPPSGVSIEYAPE